MKKLLLTCLLTLLISPISKAGDDKRLEVAEHLDRVSVTIRAKRGRSTAEGSGTLVVRKIDGKNVTFIWTAAHVVQRLKKTKKIRVNGVKKEKVYFDPVHVIQEVYEDNELVGHLNLRAVVVKYSREQDLALLRLLKKDFSKESAKFFLEDGSPKRGVRLFHTGSLLGKTGSNSTTDGILSALGRKPDSSGLIYDQTTVTALPGSSGGGVFLEEDGRYIGMLVAGYRGSDGFNLIVPIRRMVKWAKKAGVYWALDEKVDAPTEEELEKLPITGSYAPSSDKEEKDGELLRIIKKRTTLIKERPTLDEGAIRYIRQFKLIKIKTADKKRTGETAQPSLH